MGQGPVLVDLPKDVTQGDPFPECTTDFPEKVYLPGYTWQSKPAPELLAEAAALLRKSKRPLLYLGGGCIASGAHDAAKACARIDAHDRTVVLDDLRVTMRVHMLIHHGFDIRWDHADTMRIVALEVSLDKMVGNCVSMG